MTQERLENEQSFHNKRFAGDDGARKGVDKYYALGTTLRKDYLSLVSSSCFGKRVLEYGCGDGTSSVQLLEFGSRLVSIDISQAGVEKARKRVADAGYQADFYVMNAEKTSFRDEEFDVVVGTGILHHLDLSESYKELARVLNREGRVLFIEPLGHNPFINLYRLLTPRMRTKDEHPLLMKDIRFLRQFFENLDCRYYSLMTFLSVPFRGTFIFERLFRFLEAVDCFLFRMHYFRRYAWTVIIDARQPLKGSPVG